jgi:heme/copper-type cytochrome/quinol oxidase subunit 3
MFQIFEYKNCSFSIRDRVFGTTFFVSTGFHGLHVLVGTTFLIYCLIRSLKKEMVFSHHLGFEFAI